MRDSVISAASQSLRVLDLTFERGDRQLATSEAIMLAVGKQLVPPTLRLYSWSEPVVILGVGQPATDLDLETCRKRGYTILRRIGGGTAVYHDADEVSVDLIAPAGTALAPGDVHDGYRQFSEMLAKGLDSIGIATNIVSIEQARNQDQDELLRPVCFASLSPYEFMHDGRKLDGICQIRRRDVIAYQAAIYNRFPVEPVIASIRHEDESLRSYRYSRLANMATDLETAHGAPVDYQQLQAAVAAAAEDVLGVQATPGQLSDFEQQETDRLIAEKYANDEWTYRR
jgi:lipoyl(octanoyl) transferase